MSNEETGALIDLVKRTLIGDEHNDHEMEADAERAATEIVSELQSRFYLIPIPTIAEEAQTRADLAALDIPGLFHTATKGRA